jgi:uncharacterized damage-inducible protein DinB
MKEILDLFARYNQTTNKDMYEILAGIEDPDLLSKDTGAYHKSIIGFLNHMLGSTVMGAKRVIGGFPDVLGDLDGSLPEISYDNPIETLDALRDAQAQADGVMVDIVSRLTNEQCGETVTFTNWRGEEDQKVVYQLLLHTFNHETHHRGGIAVILDQFGVENDYSGLMRIPLTQ